jgi:hypothetical protein
LDFYGLKDGLYIKAAGSTMEDDYNKSGFEASSSGGEEKMYIHYRQAGYLMNALKENDFEIIDIQRHEPPGTEASQAKDLMIIAVK